MNKIKPINPSQKERKHNQLIISLLNKKNQLSHLFFFKKKSHSESSSSKLSTKFPQSSTHFSSSFPLKEQVIDHVIVTYENSAEALQKNLSLQDQKKFQELLHEAQIYPKKAYANVLSWQEKAPHIPELANLLTYLHLQHKQTKKAEALIEASFKNYPDYLFAKINYADQALRKNRPHLVEEIFPSLSLQEIMKPKKSLHVSEFRGLTILISHYYLQTKKKDQAKLYHQKAYLADPTHPSVILLEKHLFSEKILKKIFFRILTWTKGFISLYFFKS